MNDVKHKRDTPLAHHICEFYEGNTHSLKSTVIEVVRPSDCGGAWNKVILQKETEGIHGLKPLEPHGLTLDVLYNSLD